MISSRTIFFSDTKDLSCLTNIVLVFLLVIKPVNKVENVNNVTSQVWPPQRTSTTFLRNKYYLFFKEKQFLASTIA